MELLNLYKEENKEILYSLSWLNKNSTFDKSIGNFTQIDLFTFLENISQFDYKKDTFYDDIYYILEYTQDTILYLIRNINKEIKREHKILPVSQAKEFDRESILWLSRQNGRTIKEKLKNNKIKTVKRYDNVDTYENRIFKILLKKLILVYDARDDLQEFTHLFIKIRKWLKSDDAKSIDEHKRVVYNNILLHHQHYSKIFKSYKWLNSLNEKIDKLLKMYPKQTYLIIIMDMLAKLQYKSNTLVKPSKIEIDTHSFGIKCDFNNALLNKVKLLNIKISNTDISKFKDIDNINKTLIEDQLEISLNQNRIFGINPIVSDNVYLDLFRLSPICKINDDIINFPILIKQKIDTQIINANNTKVIDLNREIFTLPEILKTYDTDILKYFLEDFTKYFESSKVNYIIPDYVNIFEFSQVKKTINSYFKNNRVVPKSILAGLEYLFESDCNEGDTLIYIQKDHNNTIFVTPLLIRYDETLKSITNCLYIEKHPTKRLTESTDILDAVSEIFPRETSKKLLNKFLQNGIKILKKENIVFQNNDDILTLEKLKIPNTRLDETSLGEIKKMYTSYKLFQKDTIYLDDDNIENLNNFSKLFQYENDGFTLWREHLPKLSMQTRQNGYFDEFVLVSDESEVINGNIKISNHFIIPANTNKLSFPLLFDEESINFEAYLTSNDFPLSNDVVCELKLTYNYEDETPYALTFISLDSSIKPLKVSWREIQYKECKDLPIPIYPCKRKWEEFSKDPKRDGSGYSNLLEWIDERLALLDINKLPEYIIEKETDEAINSIQTGYFVFGKFDAQGKYFCFVDVGGEDVFCHSSNFIEDFDVNQLSKGHKVFLKVVANRENANRKNGHFISFTGISKELIIENIKNKLIYRQENKSINEKTDDILKAIKSLQYPLRTIWNNHSLVEDDVPNEFRKKMFFYLDLALELMANKEVSIKLKNELLFFFSALHQDMPKIVSDTLVAFSLDLEKNNKYIVNIALSLGNCELKWQKNILNNVINQLDNTILHDSIMEILAIASWRSENFIFVLNIIEIQRIINSLISSLEHKVNLLKNNSKRGRTINNTVKQFELLLALIRLRENNQNILCPQDVLTKRCINTVDKITKLYVENNITIRTRLKIELGQQENFEKIPDLFHALRIYLTGDTNSANSIKIIGISDD